jgi:aspartyl-tRNA synthetase
MWKTIGVEVQTPLPRMTYADAMAKYGSDKPDLRFGLEIVEATEYFTDTPFRVFQAEYVGAVRMPGGASQPRKQLDAWQDWAKQRGARGLAYVLFNEDGTLGGPAAKNLSEAEQAGLAEIDRLLAAGELEGYHLAHAARADLLRRLGRREQAAAAYRQALVLAQQGPDRPFLQKRLEELGA